MDGYIKIEDAMNALTTDSISRNFDSVNDSIMARTVRASQRVIAGLTPADVRENVRGEWIYDDRHNNFFCSICHAEGHNTPNEDGTVSLKNFCYNCGADMREVHENG